MFELTEAQRRQQLDAESPFAALEAAKEEVWRHRGAMFWREQSGRNYLVTLSTDSKQRSLGPESVQKQETFGSWRKRKELRCRIRRRRSVLRDDWAAVVVPHDGRRHPASQSSPSSVTGC